jgi:hypothetical protein
MGIADYAIMVVVGIVAWPLIFMVAYFGLAVAIGEIFYPECAGADRYTYCGINGLVWAAGLGMLIAIGATIAVLMHVRNEMSPVTDRAHPDGRARSQGSQ